MAKDKSARITRQQRRALILETFHLEREELLRMGVIKIGLFNHTEAQLDDLPDYDTHIVVDVKDDRKSFINFMGLLSFLEASIEAEVNLLLMQPRAPYLNRAIIKHTEFVQIISVAEAGRQKDQETPKHRTLSDEPGKQK